MSRQTPPNHRDPDAFAGLTQRRRARGLPVGSIEPDAEPVAFEHRMICGGNPEAWGICTCIWTARSRWRDGDGAEPSCCPDCGEEGEVANIGGYPKAVFE